MDKVCIAKENINSTNQSYDVATSSWMGATEKEGGDGVIDSADTLFWFQKMQSQLNDVLKPNYQSRMTMVPGARCAVLKFDIDFDQGVFSGKTREEIIKILRDRVLPHKPLLTGFGYETFIERYVDFKLKNAK